MKRRAKNVVSAVSGGLGGSDGQAAESEAPKGIAAIRGGTRVVEEIKHPPGKDETSLRLAARDGDWKGAFDLLNAKVSFDKPDENGHCALHYACLGGQDKIIRLLLEYKGNIEATNNTGETPLHVAAFMGQAMPVRTLLKAKANASAQDNGGQTPLHVASRLGHQPAVEQLVVMKCDPMVIDTCHQTALHLSSWKGHAEVTQTLTKHPTIKIDVVDIRAKTPMDRAAEHGDGGPGTAFHEMLEGARIKQLEREQEDSSRPGSRQVVDEASFKEPW